jgi:hypothetical protein
MYTWLWMTDPSSDAKHAIEQFQKYMRSRNPADAPLLFNNPRPPLSENGTEHLFESVLRFAYGYRDIITADNARLNTMLPDSGGWVLDLSAAGLCRDHYCNRPRRIGLRTRDARYSRERDSARRQMQKLTAPKCPQNSFAGRLSVHCTHRESLVTCPFARVLARSPLGSRTLGLTARPAGAVTPGLCYHAQIRIFQIGRPVVKRRESHHASRRRGGDVAARGARFRRSSLI